MSVLSVAPVVIASGALAGDDVHALTVLLPAATATLTPAAMVRSTASLSACEKSPPRLRFATAGRRRLAVTQSRPAMTPDELPEPLQSSTRTATSLTFFATP